MSENERKILETIARAVPQMSERQKGRVLGYGEAVLDMRPEAGNMKDVRKEA
ncbi:MAG: hypothetical protein PUB17_09350 [Lachnospiraceae bacterium]|nr:hypothetical protein [Lachnospiraceae bacterium]